MNLLRLFGIWDEDLNQDILMDKLNQIDQLQQEVYTLKQQNEQYEVKVSQIEILRRESDYQKQINESQLRERQINKRKILEKENEIEIFLKEKGELSAQINKELNNQLVMQNNIEQLKSNIKQLQFDLDNNKQANQKLNNEINDLKKEQNNEKEMKVKQLKQIEFNQLKQDQQFQQQKQKIEQLASKILEDDKNVKQLSVNIKLQESKITEQKEINHQMELDQIEKVQQLKQLMQKNDQLSSQIQQEKQNSFELSTHNQKLLNEMSQLKQDNNSHKQNISFLQQENFQYKNETMELKKQKEILQQDFNNLKIQNHNQKTKIEELTSFNSQLQATIAQKQQELEKKMKEFSLSTINTKTNEKEVKQFLTQLNPESQIETRQIEFTKQLAVVTQTPVTEEERKEMKKKDDQITNLIINQLSHPQKNQSTLNNSLFSSIIMKNYFKNNEINVFVTDQPEGSLSERQQVQNTLLFTGDHEQGWYFSLKFEEQKNLQGLISNPQSLKSYIQELKQGIGNHLSIQSNQIDNSIIVMRLALDASPSIDFQIKNQSTKTREQLKTFQPKGLSLWVKNLLENSQISASMFDPKYDFDWSKNAKGSSEFRGALPIHTKLPNYTPQAYFFPVGFKGYGLNVIHNYGSDTRWLDPNSNITTWICLFHGTSEKNIESILNSHLKAGNRDKYQGSLCRITNQQISSGKGNVYLSDQVDEAATYSKPNATFNGKKYLVVFQCRVYPFGVRSPASHPSYYTVENPSQHIRPYRILIKESP